MATGQVRWVKLGHLTNQLPVPRLTLSRCSTKCFSSIAAMAFSFDDLQLNPKLLQALRKKGFATPTPVQATCIPEALSGKDLVAQARTGTGKTLAYVLPALPRILAGSNGSAGWQALVLVPTRELCEQVKQFSGTSSAVLKPAVHACAS